MRDYKPMTESRRGINDHVKMEPSPTPMKEKQKLLEREMCPWAISKYFGD
jgi:hypothetical protein